MGAHTSYPLVIYHLISLKSHFHHITDGKFDGVIKELSKYDIQFNSDNHHTPDPTQMAITLKCDQTKMKKILRDLLNAVVSSINDHPLVIKDIVHILNISPYIEREDRYNKLYEIERDRSISIPIVLQVAPRIGDYVEIPFIRTSHSYCTDDKVNYGYVHNVRHYIRGTTQEIVVSVYNENIYTKWEEMKKEHEEHKQWLARFRAEKGQF